MTEDVAEARAGAEPDEDEFAHIPGPRYGRNPLVAAAALLMAGYLLWSLRGQLGYALSSSAPIEIDAAGALARPPLNRYVHLKGVAARSSAVLLDTVGSHKFRHMFPLVETGGRLWVLRRMGPTPLEDVAAESYTGRLVRFDELSFADTIRNSYGAPDALATPLDPARPAPPPGTSRVLLTIGCPGSKPKVPLDELEVRLGAGGRDLCEPGATAPLEHRSLAAGELAGIPSVPNVIRAVALGPATVPPDALALLEGDRPGQHWWVPVLYVVLALTILFNVYLLVLRLRH